MLKPSPFRAQRFWRVHIEVVIALLQPARCLQFQLRLIFIQRCFNARQPCCHHVTAEQAAQRGDELGQFAREAWVPLGRLGELKQLLANDVVERSA